MKTIVVVPVVVIVALLGLLGFGLTNDPRAIPSPFIGKPAPAFSLPALSQPDRRITEAYLKGEVSLVNVWASWCEACRYEHQLLVDLARSGKVRIIGMNYKDAGPDAKRWLRALGNPYTVTLVDQDGRASIDWGVYGVPETFVVDRNGVVQLKQVGQLTPQLMEEKILPLIEALQTAPREAAPEASG
ncbi:MAG: DsbE family thiol:disulfide interchange protein [Pseudomonadota bacterium]